MLSRILVTGSTGIVGSVLVPALLSAGYRVRATARHASEASWMQHPQCEFVAHALEADDPARLVIDVDAVVHLAARVHVMRERATDPLAENRRINTAATLALARAAAAAGVGQFIFASSTKVNGEATFARPFTETDTPCPQDAYALSKWEAEQQLGAMSAEHGMSVTIIRLPLVYGPGVKGNFASLLRAIARGMPLPLGAVRNRRSLVYAGNVADAIIAALARPAAGARTFLISDGEDISTPQLIRAIAAAMHRPARLVAVPVALLRLAGAMTGRSAAVARLLGSLVVDSSRIRSALGWTPRYTLGDGLAATVSSSRGL